MAANLSEADWRRWSSKRIDPPYGTMCGSAHARLRTATSLHRRPTGRRCQGDVPLPAACDAPAAAPEPCPTWQQHPAAEQVAARVRCIPDHEGRFHSRSCSPSGSWRGCPVTTALPPLRRLALAQRTGGATLHDRRMRFRPLNRAGAAVLPPPQHWPPGKRLRGDTNRQSDAEYQTVDPGQPPRQAAGRNRVFTDKGGEIAAGQRFDHPGSAPALWRSARSASETYAALDTIDCDQDADGEQRSGHGAEQRQT